MLVELNLPGAFRPEGELSSSERDGQHQEIGVLQEEVIGRLRPQAQATARKFRSVPFFAAEVEESDLLILASHPGVHSIREDIAVPPLLPRSVPLIGAPNAWSLGYSGLGQVIAILDTGVQESHPFLAGKIVFEACYSTTSPAVGSTSFCPNGSQAQVGPGSGINCPVSIEGCDHGTHVAGIAAGNGSGAGVAFSGVAKDAGLISIQVFAQFNGTECGSGPSPCALSFESDEISALEEVLSLSSQYAIAAVNMSLGAGLSTTACDTDPRKSIIDNLRSVGIPTVIAAGNDGALDGVAAPACISSAVSVGATTKSDTLAFYSDNASLLSLLAPGGDAGGGTGDILSSVPGNQFAYKAGTSMAAPHVSGTWAVFKSKNPSATVGQVLAVLQSSGVSIYNGQNGVTKSRIQVDAAIQTPVDSTPPTAPGNVAATEVSAAQIDVSWKPSTDNLSVAGYIVQRCQGPGCNNFSTLAVTTGTSYIDSGLSFSSSYTYRIQAFDPSQNASPYSVTVTTLTPGPSANPMNEQCPTQTVCAALNVGGASSGNAIANVIPLDLLDQTPAPIHYIGGTIGAIGADTLQVWTGRRAGVPTLIRMAATDSYDGILRLLQPVINPQSDLIFLDHTLIGGCGPASFVTRPADGKGYYEISGCTSTVTLPTHLGLSVVDGSAFHQSGPSTHTVLPLDQSALTSAHAAVLAWSALVANHVHALGTGGALLPVKGLSETEMQGILSQGVTDWTQLGLVTDVGTSGVPDAASPITLCLRAAGSGAKAALEGTLMKDTREAVIGSTDLTNPAAGVYFGNSPQDIVDCISGNAALGRPAHPTAIGIVEAGTATSGGYGVRLDGFYAVDPALPDPKMNVKCGKYPLWTYWRLNYRSAADPDLSSAQSALISAFVSDAQNSSTLTRLPSGAFAVALTDMYVSKTIDPGPILWTRARNPCAQ